MPGSLLPVVSTVIDEQPRGLFLRGDLTRITQVVANLFDKAIKYTVNGGHIRLHVKGDSSTVSVSVEDNGVGLESNATPSLFEIFAQAPGANDGAEAGLGIGLSIARSLMTMHDGSILAESDGPGTGSRFTIRLPLCDAPGHTIEPATRRDDNAHRPLRIMIVDDIAMRPCLLP